MRKILCLTVLLVLLSPLSGYAQSDSRCLLTALKGFNLRSGPGTGFEILGSRLPGQQLLADGQATGSEGQTWWRSHWKWLRADLVSEDGDCVGLPQVELPEPVPYEIITPANATKLQELAFASLSVPQSLAVNADGTLLALGTRAGEVLLWDAITFESLGVVAEYANKDEVEFRPGVRFHPLDPYILAVDLLDESRLFILDLSDNDILLDLKFPSFSESPVFSPIPAYATTMAFSPTGTMLATGNRDYSVRLWDIASGELINRLTLESCISSDCIPTSLDFHPVEPWIAIGMSYGGIWNYDTGDYRSFYIRDDYERAMSAVFSPDGSLLVLKREAHNFGELGNVAIWQIEPQKRLNLVRDSSSDDHGITFGVHENLFVMSHWSYGTKNGSFDIWDLGTNQCLISLPYPVRVYESAFTPDGRRLFTIGADGLRMWGIPIAS